jgi:hypothetical protein
MICIRAITPFQNRRKITRGFPSRQNHCLFLEQSASHKRSLGVWEILYCLAYKFYLVARVKILSACYDGLITQASAAFGAHKMRSQKAVIFNANWRRLNLVPGGLYHTVQPVPVLSSCLTYKLVPLEAPFLAQYQSGR